MKTLPKTRCRKCEKKNPWVYVAPVTVPDKKGEYSVVCSDCADRLRWLDNDGNIKKDINI